MRSFFDDDDWWSVRERDNEPEGEDDERTVYVESGEIAWDSIERYGEVTLDWDTREFLVEAINDYFNEAGAGFEHRVRRTMYLEAVKKQRQRITSIERCIEDLLGQLQSDDLWGDSASYRYLRLKYDGDVWNCVTAIRRMQQTCRDMQSDTEMTVRTRRGRPPNQELDDLVERLISLYQDAGGTIPRRTQLEAAEKDEIDLAVVGFVQAIGRAMDHDHLSYKEQARYRTLKMIKSNHLRIMKK